MRILDIMIRPKKSRAISDPAHSPWKLFICVSRCHRVWL